MMNREQLTPLSEMNDYAVSKEDPDVRGWSVVGASGEVMGTVRDLLVDTSRMKAEYFTVSDGGTDVLIPAASATLDRERHEVQVSGTTGLADTSRDEARPTRPDEARLTRSEEELRIGTREITAGEVVVGKHVETERITQDVPVERERVRIERRAVSHAGGAADIGADEIRIPVVEEELVVDKRVVVKEELVITKEKVVGTERVDAEVRKEEFDIAGDPGLLNDDLTARRGGR
jgi:uncharacterized protein (TIGR02271 family)